MNFAEKSFSGNSRSLPALGSGYNLMWSRELLREILKPLFGDDKDEEIMGLQFNLNKEFEKIGVGSKTFELWGKELEHPQD